MATKQIAFRLTPSDVEILDLVKEQMGLDSRSAALRFSIRHYARDHGLVGTRSKTKKRKDSNHG